MKETMHEIYQSLNAIYTAVTSAAKFISALTDWFGFSTILVLVGLLFFYKIFNALFAKSRVINFILAFIALTALWGAWNFTYYKELRLPDMAKIYGFIFLHFLALYLIHYTFYRIAEFIKKFIRRRKITDESLLELYEQIDRIVLAVKGNLKSGDIKEAGQNLEALQAEIKTIKTGKQPQNAI